MFPFHRRYSVVGRSSWIFISLLLIGCSAGAAVLPHHLQSQLQEHLEPKPPSENGCSSKPVLPRLLRYTWILAGT